MSITLRIPDVPPNPFVDGITAQVFVEVGVERFRIAQVGRQCWVVYHDATGMWVENDNPNLGVDVVLHKLLWGNASN